MLGLEKNTLLKEAILKAIHSGELRTGSVIPSRHQLMETYHCSRGTVDSAIEGLIKSGVLTGKRGSGTFVAIQADNRATEITRYCVIGDYSRVEEQQNEPRNDSIALFLCRNYPCRLFAFSRLNITMPQLLRLGQALIWLYPSYYELRLMSHVAELGLPQLLIMRNYGDFDHIITNAEVGISAGLDWLCEHAGREVGFITTRPNDRFPYIAERQLLFYELAMKKNMKINPNWYYMNERRPQSNGAYIEACMEAAAQKLWDGKKICKAVYLDFFFWTSGLLNAAERRGLVPEKDFHLLVFDNCKLCNGIACISLNTTEIKERITEWINNAGMTSMKVKVLPKLVIGK